MHWDLKISARDMSRLMNHLFPGDNDEHGAVLAVGTARAQRSNRFLVRDVFLAKDGIDYVAGQRGYRMLRAEFVRDCAYHCSDEGLAYLAVHNHSGANHVAFSPDDMASHERGYPGLIQLVQGPVGALVFSRNAVAGDFWFPDGGRKELRRLEIVGPSRRYLYPSAPEKRPLATSEGTRSRQALLFGDQGQAVLRELRVGVIGAGGVGSVIVAQLARLGVGNLVLVDPEKIEESNFSRLAASRSSDYSRKLIQSSIPWVGALGRRLSKFKVDIAKRLFQDANPLGSIEAIVGDFRSSEVAQRFVDCDYLFLAADTMQARLLFNAISLQFMIPGAQAGAKATTDKTNGNVLQAFSVSRRVLPEAGCLWCNGLIPPLRLQEESESYDTLRRQKYIDDPEVNAPSVISMNSVAASLAVNQFLFSVTGLASETRTHDYTIVDALTGETLEINARRDVDCPECGETSASRRSRGDGARLPTKVSTS